VPLSFEDSTQSDEPSAVLTLKTALLMELLKNSRHLNAETDAAFRWRYSLGCSAFCLSVPRLAKYFLHLFKQTMFRIFAKWRGKCKKSIGSKLDVKIIQIKGDTTEMGKIQGNFGRNRKEM
jgi:hypothetical protein